MLSGGLSSCCTNLILFPFIVVHLQYTTELRLDKSDKFKGVFDCMKKTVKQRGFRGFFKGYKYQMVLGFLFRSLWFGLYDFAKNLKIVREQKARKLARLVTANTTTLIASTILYPLDTIRANIITKRGSYNTRKLVRNLYQRGLYLGFSSNIIRCIGSSLVLFVFDELKLKIIKK